MVLLICLVAFDQLVTADSYKLLVLGGSGYVGRQVCKEAVAKGWEVTSLSRRGENPLPGSSLDKVSFVAGDAADMELLLRLAGEADAVVHSIGLLLDSESGLGNLNFLTSGSRSVPGDKATYDSEMKDTALNLLEALKMTKRDSSRPYVFVSAAEVGWEDNKAGTRLEDLMREKDFFLPRYLDAKRAVEKELVSESEDAGVRPIIARPSFMYDATKLDILPLLPVWFLGHKLNIGDGAFSIPLRVETAGSGIVQIMDDGSVKGVVSSSDILAAAPLAAIRRPDGVDTLTSGIASIARIPFGTNVAPELTSGSGERPPASSIRIYEFEGCPFCRRVREIATHLDLEYTAVPCGQGSRHREYVKKAAESIGNSSPTFPYMEDEAAGVKLFESEDIMNHLISTYGGGAGLPKPAEYFLPSTIITGWVPTLMRLFKGGKVVESVVEEPDEPLVLWNYEGNQFCRLVREAMVELDLTYVVKSIGKGSPRREELRELAGTTVAPFFEDLNTGKKMGDSADIVEYLFRTYSSK
ncbi:hypothetical protein TrLO_g11463 [Triparma laevis f. longispina]|uniref:GST N-terminal domain-containing protein n=1 Tax=Triparma laevis f. longispina TaxID=1714387 RepID=A0A9W7KVR0_9STRA|nr:hypothetical protein TrLO_g11463 [Triparma laevis f. longispina]